MCFGWPDDPRHCSCVRICLCELDRFAENDDEDLLGLVWDEGWPAFRPVVTVEIPGVSR